VLQKTKSFSFGLEPTPNVHRSGSNWTTSVFRATTDPWQSSSRSVGRTSAEKPIFDLIENGRAYGAWPSSL